MLDKSDVDVASILSIFGSKSVEVGLLVPTGTGLEKSILDATGPVRDYLHSASFHDYSLQGQGPDHKRVLPAYFVHQRGAEPTNVSLYRPNTKSGDPRIWFRGLKNYARPYNLLALIVHKGALYIVNCSNAEIINSINKPGSPLHRIVTDGVVRDGGVADDLLQRMRSIAAKGFIKTLREGDTGVGMTLETSLGIAANSSKEPDYLGIELKAARARGGRRSRSGLFSQKPDWNLSPIGSAWNLLSNFGSVRDEVLSLRCTMSATMPNPAGFILAVDGARDWLLQNCETDQGGQDHLVTWKLETLRERLREKHQETFWVTANCRGGGASEAFHYIRVKHTRAPILRNFEPLIESGDITIDYTMKDKGNQKVRDHGYLFKIKPRALTALIPLVGEYDLV